MTGRILISIILLMMLALPSCEKDSGCKWCTTVAIVPYHDDVIVGRGYACGDDLDIIMERQHTWRDTVTGELYLVITYCEDGPPPRSKL